MKQTNHWIKNPTKKQLIVVVLLGLTSSFLLLLSITNFFTESPFQGKFSGSFFLILASGFAVYQVCRNYYKSNILQKKEID